MDTMNSEQAAFFDSQADATWADTPYGHEEAPKLERLASQCGSLAGCIVLEPGCGTGRLTQWLASAVGPSGFVHACDISQLMVRRALARTRGFAQVRVSYAAMENLHLGRHSVDLVVCHQVFPHFSNKPGALAYMANVLKPGGTLFIVHFECRRFINDVHRKAGTVVAQDLIPDRGQIEKMLDAVGLGVRYYSDDPRLGYLLKASPNCGNS
jgi:demethylmenaquinone methyltransferase/2-methoxy-6-polyprenyl-1,4-benzoquinol methylase